MISSVRSMIGIRKVDETTSQGHGIVQANKNVSNNCVQFF